ncbi:MAG: CDP-glucose 4,6-dehydratase, partial [bacterium]|nr:CDP-glucose 4,6-dehydratase [bacterium]
MSIWLNLLGAKVVGYSLAPPTVPSLFDLAGLEGKIEHIEDDVRDAKSLLRALKRTHPEVVFHLAAQPLVGESYKDPLLTYGTNVMGTVNLLEAVRACDTVRVCQIVTTDKCYENREWVYAYREEDRLGGRDPYSSSKVCAELVTRAYRDSIFTPGAPGEDHQLISSVRAGNVIGGGDWALDRLVPDCFRAVTAGLPMVLRNPEAVRPWQHVLDCLSGYLWLAVMMWKNGGEYASAWNFGPEIKDAVSVKDLIGRLIRIWESEGENIPAPGQGAGAPLFKEAHYLKLDCTKAFSLLDWRPVMDLEEA